MLRISRILALALTLSGVASHLAKAEEWPNRPVRVIIPYAAGGAADFLGRVFAEQLTVALGQSFFVENRTGGGGVVGTEAVVRAKPDGYTLMVSGLPSHVIAPGMNANANYDAIRDFTHIAYFGGPPNVFVVHPSFGAKTFAEFMAKVKDAKQGIEYVSPGLGTGGNMVAEYFKIKSGAKLIHVGYRGGGAAIMDLIAGHVKVGSMTLSTTIPHIRAGSLIPLAVSSAERVPDLPNVPTLKELGYPDLIATTWFSLSGPANLPKEIVDKVNRAVVASLSSDKVQQHLKQEEIQVKPMTPEQLTDFIGSERDKWHPVLAIIGKTN
jgi:tripartite-type tricarboxylate transporter receptor subunit TctC